jgi:hypothetical protein
MMRNSIIAKIIFILNRLIKLSQSQVHRKVRINIDLLCKQAGGNLITHMTFSACYESITHTRTCFMTSRIYSDIEIFAPGFFLIKEKKSDICST